MADPVASNLVPSNFDWKVDTEAYVPLDPGLYLEALGIVKVRPWVFDGASGLMKRGAGPFIPVGDVEEFKLSYELTRVTRKARDRKIRTKAVDRVSEISVSLSFTAMQHSAIIRSMSLLASAEGQDSGLPTDQVQIGSLAQNDLEVLVYAIGEQGPKGVYLLHRAQVSTKDSTLVGGDDFQGAQFDGGLTDVPGLGIGLWAPYQAA